MTDTPDQHHRAFKETPAGYRWDGVEHLPYKQDGRALFDGISRQTLFRHPGLAGELRYFEIDPGGHSTLERHEHIHAVLILRGGGQALIGGTIASLATNDLVTIPPMTWHQFRANSGSALGFLCMVDATRDKPQLPTQAELASLTSNPAIAAFLASK